ncbi:hypothetical protein BC628DRAFT_1117751 [Trametes gibbosa]|nr:hypothetical protein BC628DRAFT_1117751 [Trametes gibbosa]
MVLRRPDSSTKIQIYVYAMLVKYRLSDDCSEIHRTDNRWEGRQGQRQTQGGNMLVGRAGGRRGPARAVRGRVEQTANSRRPCVRPRFRATRFAGGACSVFAVVGESSPVRPPWGAFRFSVAFAMDGVVGPPGVGADAGVDADAAGVEPDACEACGVPLPVFGSIPSDCAAFWDGSPPDEPCEGPATALPALITEPFMPFIPCPSKAEDDST